MKKSKKKWIIIVDCFTALGFFIAFKLNWTGLRLHELLGLLVGGLTLIHLRQHWKWVRSVSKKFFGAPTKIKFRYLIDAGLFYGFMIKIGTGILISSLLNLYLSNYETWRFIHVTVSYALLVLIGLKLELHWKWIVNTAKCLIKKPVSIKTAVQCDSSNNTQTDAKRISRQDALKTMGVFGAFSLISAVGYEKWLKDTNAFNNAANTPQPQFEPPVEPTVNPTQTATPLNTETAKSPINTGETAIVNNTATPYPTETPTISPTATLQVSNGTVRCPRGCSYPGRCRRYTDSNNNNICDLSEW